MNLARGEQDTVSIPHRLTLLAVAIQVCLGILLVGVIPDVGIGQEDVTIGCQCQTIVGCPGARPLITDDDALVTKLRIAIGIKQLKVQLIGENIADAFTTQPGQNDFSVVGTQRLHLHLTISAFLVEFSSVDVAGLPIGHHRTHGKNCHHHKSK